VSQGARSPDLSYHLRELSADLRAAQATLDALETARDRGVLRLWVELEALLDHDLEVHIPAALRLLGGMPVDRSHRAFKAQPDEDENAQDDAAAEVGRLLSAAQEEFTEPPRADNVASAAALLEQALQIASAARAQTALSLEH
jgi:hypothetical protein